MFHLRRLILASSKHDGTESKPMTMTKDTQTSHYLGGWMPAARITAMLAEGYTVEQIAFQLGLRPADVARVLAMPAPT
jgi:hypothetical protein